MGIILQPSLQMQRRERQGNFPQKIQLKQLKKYKTNKLQKIESKYTLKYSHSILHK